MKINLPNYLTFLRIVLSFICIGFIIQNNLSSLVIAFVLFLIASITDFFDGYIARKYNLITDLGKILDPIADKLLVLGVFLSFLFLNVINVWMVVVIIFREFLLTAVRFLALSQGKVLAAQKWGKHKTVSQMVIINYIFILLICLYKFPGDPKIVFLYSKTIPIFMWYVVFITAFSGVQYLWSNREIIVGMGDNSG